MIGDIYHGFFEPDDAAYLCLRLFIMLCLGVLGIVIGVSLQRYLRDRWKLALFGYDNGQNEDREPLADQDGAIFLILCFVCVAAWNPRRAPR